jgi:predicted aspartyl protease
MVTGTVDDRLRALVQVLVGPSRSGQRQEILAWVDTAFNGGLTIPRPLIASLGLPQQSSIEAVLADGRITSLETYGCFFEWFGGVYSTQVVASDGAFPLLGTQLLDGHRLMVNYPAKTIEIH